MREGTLLEKLFNIFVVILVVFGILYFSIKAFATVAHEKVNEQYMRNCGFDTVVIKLDNHMVNEDIVEYIRIKGLFRDHKLLKTEKQGNTVIFTLVRDNSHILK